LWAPAKETTLRRAALILLLWVVVIGAVAAGLVATGVVDAKDPPLLQTFFVVAGCILLGVAAAQAGDRGLRALPTVAALLLTAAGGLAIAGQWLRVGDETYWKVMATTFGAAFVATYACSLTVVGAPRKDAWIAAIALVALGVVCVGFVGTVWNERAPSGRGFLLALIAWIAATAVLSIRARLSRLPPPSDR
jgi:hypothetical protein